MLLLVGSDLIVQRASYILGNGGVEVAARVDPSEADLRIITSSFEYLHCTMTSNFKLQLRVDKFHSSTKELTA